MDIDLRSSRSRRRMSVLIPVNLIMIAAAATVLVSDGLQVVFLAMFAIGALINLTLIRRVIKDEDVLLPAMPRLNIEAFLRGSQARRSTIRDESTGLCTRWYLDFRLDEEAARCRRYNHPMAVVVLRTGMMELSSFSEDDWQARSAEAARRAASIVRNVDLSAALSPFEFAICLVHCDRNGAERALDRLTSELSEYSCEAGVCVFPDDGLEPSVMIEVARTRLCPWPKRTALSRPA